MTYGVDAGIGESDNVTLAHDGRISQTIAVTDIDFAYETKSQRLDLDAKGNFSYLDYLQNAYGNQLLGRFDGTAILAIIPQRLTWMVQESYGQAAIDPFTPVTPTNLENIDYVATGPDLYLRLANASFLDLSAHIARVQYETSPFSNSRTLGSAAWGLTLSPTSSVSLNASHERVLFENTILNTDFDRSNVYIHYELKGARTELSTDLGATVIGEGGKSTTGGLATIKLDRTISSSAHIIVSLGHDSTDGSSSFGSLQSGGAGVVGTAPATNTSQSYTRNYGSVSWDYNRNRTELGLSGRWERDDYANLRALDRTMSTGELRVRRMLTRALAFQVTARVYRSDYGNASVIDTNGSANATTNSFGAAITWRPARALEVKLACEHSTYTTLPSSAGYLENRVFLTVGYRPFKTSPISAAVPGL